MARKLNPASIFVIVLGAVALAAYPIWRWFTAPAGNREPLASARPFRGTVLEPVALNLMANPKTPPEGRTVGDVRFAPSYPRLVPFTDPERKAMKSEIDESLRLQGIPMDRPTMRTGAAPNAVFLTAEVRAQPDTSDLVDIEVRLSASKSIYERGARSAPVNAVILQEFRRGRVVAADTKKAIVVLVGEALDTVVQRWRAQNAP